MSYRSRGGRRAASRATAVAAALAAVAVAGVSAGGAAPVRAAPPGGWIVAGSAPSDYEFGTDASNATSGRRSAYILALPLASASGFGTLMQTIVADDYRGARWRLTASLRTEDATRAQLWMRVDGADRKVLAFDNMDARPLIGTRPWAPYEIVLDVPADAVSISFGFVLAQHGKVWADGFRLEKVPLSVPITARAATPPRAPVNTDFEN